MSTNPTFPSSFPLFYFHEFCTLSFHQILRVLAWSFISSPKLTLPITSCELFGGVEDILIKKQENSIKRENLKYMHEKKISYSLS